jgi:type II secretory pathway pseudopilin PulG
MKAAILSSGTRRGFTLVEMVVTLGVFILLAASVFGILSAILQSSSALADDQFREDEAGALTGYLQHQFRHIAERGLALTYRRAGQEQGPGLIFGTASKMVALEAAPAPNGLCLLRETRFVPPRGSQLDARTQALLLERMVLRDDDALVWTPLLRDVRTLAWRFQDAKQAVWTTVLPDTGTQPALIELTLEIAGDRHERTADFWIPTVVAAFFQAPRGGLVDVL